MVATQSFLDSSVVVVADIVVVLLIAIIIMGSWINKSAFSLHAVIAVVDVAVVFRSASSSMNCMRGKKQARHG